MVQDQWICCSALGLRLKAVIHLKCNEWQLRAQGGLCNFSLHARARQFFLYQSQKLVRNNVEIPSIHADYRKLETANSQLNTQSESVAEKHANSLRLIASNRSLQACEIVDQKILAFVVLSLVSNKRARLGQRTIQINFLIMATWIAFGKLKTTQAQRHARDATHKTRMGGSPFGMP